MALFMKKTAQSINYHNPVHEEIKAEYKLSGDKTFGGGRQSLTQELKQAELRKVLNSLVLLIHCNYPDTYKSVLREWGFQKEKY
jgi:hypothetical protein